ncbi:LRR receptor-like serine/threonine-protein kinase GSO1 [Carica papaya]|uniref:LRR receptor-like serine/threonine-protein kinase GSO1 n=1 Tax=Carica papaya TaxID=3649 RepID=UPI000B8C6E51|nr:LRR receptor-like serine/threonine-protein kinase GSO1 [Carica papaya]
MITYKNLKVLDFDDNHFSGNIPPEIGELSSLKVFSVYSNELNDSLPIPGLCSLKHLEELDLSWNIFQGSLPTCLNNLTSLKLLDLTQNQFTGSIPSSLIAGLASLEYIDLSHNHFEGLFSFSSFANHSNLEVVQLVSDNSKFEVGTEDPDWVPSFQLRVLVLSNCNLNKLTGQVPTFLFNQFNLLMVDLSHNNLTGSFPSWFLQNNIGLQRLYLRNNSFTDQLQLWHVHSIIYLDISSNDLNGRLQENIGKLVPHLLYLNLSNNAFEGSLPSSVGDLNELEGLDLSNNNFTGEVPKELIINCTRICVLNLSNNKFYGEIFSSHFNLTSITSLHLNNNFFNGTLSNAVLQCPSLKVFDVGKNCMSGKISRWLDNITNLDILLLNDNFFEGEIPCKLGRNKFRGTLGLVDLSHNSLSGSLPSCLRLEMVQRINLQGNNLSGQLPKGLLNSSTLLMLNIRDNGFVGSIPDIITVPNLRVMLLGGNYLSGTIPKALCQLRKISFIDLSRNFLSGSILHCFNNIAFGNLVTDDRIFKLQGIIGDFWHFSYYKFKSLSYDVLRHQVVSPYTSYYLQDEVEFITKNRSNSYEGDILNYMSALDLSYNNLTGDIPEELGLLSQIHALNLSHNQLTGSIPTTFSNLNKIESLDLSHNNLIGEIPSELNKLHFLGAFTVAYNNLSGKIPNGPGQLGTFEKRSFEGNKFLCGFPLEKKCGSKNHWNHVTISSSDQSGEKWLENDWLVFFASFSVAFIIFFSGVISVLYINPYWQHRFYECIYSYYYFVCDTFYKFFCVLV